MFYSYEQLDCALGSEVISEISLNRPELRPYTYLPSPYYPLFRFICGRVDQLLSGRGPQKSAPPVHKKLTEVAWRSI
jgi:hypothetical protein